MTGPGREADGPAPDAGGDTARAAVSAAGGLESEVQTGRDARLAGLAGRQRYQIRVRGRLGPTICSAFPALRARADGGDTVLTGVLAEAEALGLELLEVRRLPSRDEPWAPSS